MVGVCVCVCVCVCACARTCVYSNLRLHNFVLLLRKSLKKSIKKLFKNHPLFMPATPNEGV